METTKIKTELFCINCNEDTVHEVVYFGDKIMKIYCTKCNDGTHSSDDVMKEDYLEEMVHRVLTKKKRIAKEFKVHPIKTVVSLPSRIITKPFRIEKEYKEIKKILK